MGSLQSPCEAPIERGFTTGAYSEAPLYRSFAGSSLGRVCMDLGQQYAARGICSSLGQ